MTMDKPARRKTPQQKKQDIYDKDRFGDKEFPHLFRKGKPRKKKGVNRQEHSRTRNLIQNSILNGEVENLAAPILKTVADPIYHFPWKGARTVRTIVARKLASRKAREEFSHFKKQKAAPTSDSKGV